jgi:hypothetical protein
VSGEEYPVKWQEVKEYVRLDSDGQPQLVRVEPITDENGDLIPYSVAVHFDNREPLILDRQTADAMIISYACVPLEQVAQYKHRKVN